MTKNYPKILIIDDVPANVIMLAESLADEFEIEFALSGTSGLVLAAQTPLPDLILLDILMPYMDGYQTYQRLKENRSLQKIPVIFITALTDNVDERQALNLGAADYITKPINIQIAKLRIRNLLERERQRREIELYRNRLAALVGSSQALATAQYQGTNINSVTYYDPLTGLPNRRLLMDRLNQAITHAERFKRWLAVCYLDVDNFRSINNQLGYDVGDKILVEISDRLKAMLRQHDVLARPGCDEFVLLLENIEQNTECYEIVDQILATIRTPITINNQDITVTTSVGIAFYPHDGDNAESMLRNADHAMYQAKHAGKDRFADCIKN